MLPKMNSAPRIPNSNAISAWMDISSLIGMRQCRPILLSIALLALGACTMPINQATDKSTGFFKELPEGVALIAAPYQNLQEVILQPEDGCYWYRYVGPVETTMLPLRTVEGRPICTKAGDKPLVTG